MVTPRHVLLVRVLATVACAGLVGTGCVAGAAPASAPGLSSPVPMVSAQELSSPSATPTMLSGATSGASGAPPSVSPSPPRHPAPTPSRTEQPTAAPNSQPTPTNGTAVLPTEITEANNGQTIAAPVGTVVTLVLHNTYWIIVGSSNPNVLVLGGPPVYSGAGPIKCIPGTGCGTVTAAFRAMSPGSAVITASRTSCGEALQCTGSAARYMVTVVVGS